MKHLVIHFGSILKLYRMRKDDLVLDGPSCLDLKVHLKCMYECVKSVV